MYRSSFTKVAPREADGLPLQYIHKDKTKHSSQEQGCYDKHDRKRAVFVFEMHEKQKNQSSFSERNPKSHNGIQTP
jgi:hypothetical protein